MEMISFAQRGTHDERRRSARKMGGNMSKSRQRRSSIAAVAGNGLLDRRALLGRGIMVAGAMGAGAAGALTGAAAEPLAEAPWSLEPGDVTPPYGHPSRFEKAVVRTVDNPKNEPSGSRARCRAARCAPIEKRSV